MREIRAWIAGLTEARGPRMSMMIERLATFGIHVDEAKVLARADGAVGRPHLAAELLEMGVVETFQQAFDDWIGDGAPANVERPRPTLAEASARVHAAGGFCPWLTPCTTACQPERCLICSHRWASKRWRPSTEATRTPTEMRCGVLRWNVDYRSRLDQTTMVQSITPAPDIGRSRLRTCLKPSGACGSTAKQPVDDEPNLEEEHHRKRHEKQGQRVGRRDEGPHDHAAEPHVTTVGHEG